jgi:probable addiction module antidote protein
MTKPKTKLKLLPFDAARYLTDEASIAEYVTAVLETQDSSLLLLALGDTARARRNGSGHQRGGPGQGESL